MMRRCAFLLIFFMPLIGCGRSELHSKDSSLEESSCSVNNSPEFLLVGLSASKAGAAIEGSPKDAQEILYYLLSKSDTSADPRITCQVKAWAEIAATNGSIEGAYEAALMSNSKGWYECRRAKHWAKFVVRNITQFDKLYKPGTDRELIQRAAEGRIDDMNRLIKITCPLISKSR